MPECGADVLSGVHPRAELTAQAISACPRLGISYAPCLKNAVRAETFVVLNARSHPFQFASQEPREIASKQINKIFAPSSKAICGQNPRCSSLLLMRSWPTLLHASFKLTLADGCNNGIRKAW